MELTSGSFRRLYQASHKRLKEDFAAQSAEVIQRETGKLLDIEATKLLAQCTLIINGSGTSTDKLGELCSLLLSYDDDDDEDAGTTAVDTNPHAKG